MKFSPVKSYKNYRHNAIAEFFTHVDVLLKNEQVRELNNFTQHHCFTRLEHSMDVAYYSFFVSKLLGWDSRSAARAGLLHDLFLYDRYAGDCKIKGHLRGHPKVALKNARCVCELNEIEEDIIKKHMWLITPWPPRYKESFVVTFVDKYCALREFFIGVFSRGVKPESKLAKHQMAA